MPLPQRGDCRMGGYGAPPERDLSPYCFNVYTSYVGLFMFARLYASGRVSDAAPHTHSASTHSAVAHRSLLLLPQAPATAAG